MEHAQANELIHPYVDGELDLSNARALETHLQGCAECRAVAESVRVLRAAVARSDAAYRAPARLHHNVRAAIRQEAKERDHVAMGWLPWATAAACAVLLGAFAFISLGHRSGDAIADEVIANHVRSLLATHLVDVPSSDQHTVKPWFNGKVDFAPEVHDFTSDGFPLEGGRLDYLENRTSAALVYRKDRHVINVFTSPAPGHGDSGASALTRRGYHLMHWTKDGVDYWAVSDLNAVDLGRLVELLRR